MKTMNALTERAYAFTQEMPRDTISTIHRCLSVNTALREGVITI